MDIPKRKLGKTGVDTTIIGLGGEGILRTYGHEEEAYELINRAIDMGVRYFESARAYSGSESYYGLALKERRKDIFLTSKSHARNKAGAWSHLQETLSNMKTDYLDRSISGALRRGSPGMKAWRPFIVSPFRNRLPRRSSAVTVFPSSRKTWVLPDLFNP